MLVPHPCYVVIAIQPRTIKRQAIDCKPGAGSDIASSDLYVFHPVFIGGMLCGRRREYPGFDQTSSRYAGLPGDDHSGIGCARECTEIEHNRTRARHYGLPAVIVQPVHWTVTPP